MFVGPVLISQYMPFSEMDGRDEQGERTTLLLGLSVGEGTL